MLQLDIYPDFYSYHSRYHLDHSNTILCPQMVGTFRVVFVRIVDVVVVVVVRYYEYDSS